MAGVAAATPGAAHADPGGDGIDVVELARGQLVVDAARGFGLEGLREGTLRALTRALLGALGNTGGAGIGSSATVAGVGAGGRGALSRSGWTSGRPG